MDYDLEACTPPSRRSRPLAWLAAGSGLALALFIVGSPGAASPSVLQPAAAIHSTANTVADRVTTGSILPASPVRLVHVPAGHGHNLPLPQSERHILIVLLFLCFVVMSAGGLALWKRGWRDVVQRETSQDSLAK